MINTPSEQLGFGIGTCGCPCSILTWSLINNVGIRRDRRSFLRPGCRTRGTWSGGLQRWRVVERGWDINPRRMRSEGYSSRFVCLSVTVLTAANFVCKAKVRYHRVLHDIIQICNVWISLKTLRPKVMVLFAYHRCLPRSLKSSRWTKDTAASSF